MTAPSPAKEIATLIVIIITAYSACYGQSRGEEVCFKDNCFYVETATTPSERTRGLMFRKRLGNKEGMLFIFKNDQKHSFWMKNTLIPLDIIWINKYKEVVFIKKDAQPCRNDPCQIIDPDKTAMYVLELNAGVSDAIGLCVGDKLNFDVGYKVVQ